MLKKVLLLILLLSITASIYAQNEHTWTLQRCVQYALEHNISIKQSELNTQMSENSLLQSKLGQLPSLNLSGTYGRSFGRSINPTTNQFVDEGYNFLSPSISSGAVIFGWNQVRSTIQKNKYTLQAALADLDQLKSDISLNVANSFLMVLLANEQVNISNNQIQVSKAQLEQTVAFANAGRLPELNVAQLTAQLASDSANLINAQSSYNAAVLDLKTLLNLDFSTPFIPYVAEASVGDIAQISYLQPENIYEQAQGQFGMIKGSLYRLQAAQKGLRAAKGNLYPQLSFGYQLGTNYASSYQSVVRYEDMVVQGYNYIELDNATRKYLYEYYRVPILEKTKLGAQFENNLRQTLSLNLNVPLFNAGQSHFAIKQSQLDVQSQMLNQYNTALTLKQNVFKAHNNAQNAIQKYYAAKRAADAAQRALDFARKRYDLGLSSTVDLLVTQNSAFNAAANLVIAKYDLIFKLKVIDYYLGKEIKM